MLPGWKSTRKLSTYLRLFTLIILIQVWDPIARKLITSRDIIFEEHSTMEPTGGQIADEEENYYSIFPNDIDQVVLTLEL